MRWTSHERRTSWWSRDVRSTGISQCLGGVSTDDLAANAGAAASLARCSALNRRSAAQSPPVAFLYLKPASTMAAFGAVAPFSPLVVSRASRMEPSHRCLGAREYRHAGRGIAAVAPCVVFFEGFVVDVAP